MKLKNKLAISSILTMILFAFLIPSAYALQSRTRKKASTAPTVVSVSQGVRAKVRFRADRRAILIDFSNFDNVQSVSYSLVYDANGIPQGAGGTVSLSDTSTRTLLFATCSGNVCTYHKNITNARLAITSTLKNGKKIMKPFRLKV